jgi:hypothetical protein
MDSAARVGSVEKNVEVSGGRLRHAHEILFCLNLALVFKLEGNQSPNGFLSLLDFGEITLQSRINSYLHLHPHHAFGANTAFLLLVLVLASLMFVLLRVLLASSLIARVFNSVAGVISLVALAIGWLCVAGRIGVTPPLPNPPHWLLYLELVAVAGCAVLYFAGTWRIPVWLTIVLLALHFAYWGFIVSGGPYFWREPFRLVFPVAGFFATLFWGLSIPNSRSQARVNHRFVGEVPSIT